MMMMIVMDRHSGGQAGCLCAGRAGMTSELLAAIYYIATHAARSRPARDANDNADSWCAHSDSVLLVINLYYYYCACIHADCVCRALRTAGQYMRRPQTPAPPLALIVNFVCPQP